MRKQFFFFLMFLTSACTINENAKVVKYDGFPNEVFLKSTEIKTPPVLFNVGGMISLDSVLITFNLKGNTFFKIFRLPKLQYIGDFVGKGRGPNEEIYIDPFIQRLSANSFFYRSITSIKIVNFNLIKNNIEFTRVIKLPSYALNLQHLFFIQDTLICGWDLLNKQDKEFLAYDFNTKKIIPFGPKYSSVIKDVPIKSKASIFSKIITVKPDKTAFAAAYDKFKMLRIFDRNGTLLKEVRFNNTTNLSKNLILNNFKNIDFDNIIMHYQKIHSTNRYIYALYSGKPMSYVPSENRGIIDICNEIHVWNWEGKPIAKLTLDKNVFSFAVLNDDNYLICSNTNNLDKLFKYELNLLK